MATLTISNLPDTVQAKLRDRAAESGRSVEDEACAILADVCRGESDQRVELRRVQALVRDLYGGNPPKNVVDEFIAERRREAEAEW